MENLVNANENDNIVADFEDYIKTQEDLEEELKTLEHLIKSSRGLLSRLDDNLNSMSISGKQSVEVRISKRRITGTHSRISEQNII